jgi:microcystin-dependent protein
MKSMHVVGASIIATFGAGSALAQTTGPAGKGQWFENRQPSFAITEVLATQGILSGAGAEGDTIGFVYNFAGDFTPGSSLAARGQLFSISKYPALFGA